MSDINKQILNCITETAYHKRSERDAAMIKYNAVYGKIDEQRSTPEYKHFKSIEKNIKPIEICASYEAAVIKLDNPIYLKIIKLFHEHLVETQRYFDLEKEIEVLDKIKSFLEKEENNPTI